MASPYKSNIMKNILSIYPIAFGLLMCTACSSNADDKKDGAAETTISAGGQEAVVDNESQKDIVKIAVGSADHSTLVAALTQADYVNDLSNAGPFTVFAPTNAAFDKLPEGTVDDLMKDENQAALRNILEYHVAVGSYRQEYLSDGQTLGMANGDNVTINITGDKMTVNGNNVVATVPASNGLIYIVDGVLLPPAKK